MRKCCQSKNQDGAVDQDRKALKTMILVACMFVDCSTYGILVFRIFYVYCVYLYVPYIKNIPTTRRNNTRQY